MREFHKRMLWGTVPVFGRRVGIWVLALGIAVAGAGVAGAAQAATGEANLTVSQSLVVLGGNVTGASDAVFALSDDGTAFSTAASTWTGGRYAVNISLGNKLDKALTADLTVDAPQGIRVGVSGADGVAAVARMSDKTWKLVVSPNESDSIPDLSITVTVGETMAPGSYSMKMGLEQVAY